ncbi:uncharacterized protein LOC128266415 [Drosophila gunungcola]|nr:uncharacterized protein LOC128266415 [Drosophila gunungcola]XP_052858875.1 uncharacterized protein LOC128266415 [Drosophila gunungcola]
MSILTIKSNSSFADVLRGKTIPVSRLSQKSMAKAQGQAKKVEQFLTKAKSSSLISLGGLPSHYEFNRLQELNQWWEPRTRFRDEADVSLHPSYQMKQFSYDLNCYVRYLEAKERHERQFAQEMEHFIANQRNICDQFFLKAILCYKTRWPPLHTKRELNNFVSKFFQMTAKEKRRVEYLMKTDLGLGY